MDGGDAEPHEPENVEQKDTASLKTDLEVKQASQENVSKVSEIKARISAEIEKVEQSMTEISKMKQESIEKIELKKKELRELSGAAEVCKEQDETMREMKIRGREIEERKISITVLDQTIANLDKQIAQIQSEHDKATGELDLKKRKLNEQLQYYDALNERLTGLLELLQKESKEHEEKLNELLRQREELLQRTDLSEAELNKMLAELDEQINTLNKENEQTMNVISKRLSDMEISEPILAKGYDGIIAEGGSQLLTEVQIQELQVFESNLHRLLHPKMTHEERLALLRRGLQITPSGRIITKDDRVITLMEARLLGLLDDLDQEEEEEELGYEPELSFLEKIESKSMFYASTPSELSSSEKSSSIESELDTRDIDYLKRVFGKSLSLALAEITAVQPSDPIHYLAHWFIKYRYDQEIDEVRRLEIQALMIERERIEAERWHAELEEEAYLAVLEALFRAENIIRQQDYERMLMMQQETEGEYEVEFNPMDFFT